MECIKSSTSTRDKVNSQYISECDPHLTSQCCGVKLDLKSNFKTSNLF